MILEVGIVYNPYIIKFEGGGLDYDENDDGELIIIKDQFKIGKFNSGVWIYVRKI